jgi:creatinine amidohydrolase
MGETDHVCWEDLLPEEFEARLTKFPVVYLPLGLCEPHGHIAPFGLDTHKARYLCEESARRFGGIVAPTMAYQIHETGYHAPWLKEVMGGINPRLAALPPHVVLESFLYQLRAFRNAGFKGVVAVSGHHGGNQEDLRKVARAFSAAFPIDHFVCSDPELVAGLYEGDHAGRYEISQLLAIRPDLIDLGRVERARSDRLGRFAQNPDADEASAALGADILEAALASIRRALEEFALKPSSESTFIPMESMVAVWASILADRANWRTLNL